MQMSTIDGISCYGKAYVKSSAPWLDIVDGSRDPGSVARLGGENDSGSSQVGGVGDVLGSTGIRRHTYTMMSWLSLMEIIGRLTNTFQNLADCGEFFGVRVTAAVQISLNEINV